MLWSQFPWTKVCFDNTKFINNIQFCIPNKLDLLVFITNQDTVSSCNQLTETIQNVIAEKTKPIKTQFCCFVFYNEQESPAIADKPAQRESLPKIAPIRRAYNVVADSTGLSSFV